MPQKGAPGVEQAREGGRGVVGCSIYCTSCACVEFGVEAYYERGLSGAPYTVLHVCALRFVLNSTTQGVKDCRGTPERSCSGQLKKLGLLLRCSRM